MGAGLSGAVIAERASKVLGLKVNLNYGKFSLMLFESSGLCKQLCILALQPCQLCLVSLI